MPCEYHKYTSNPYQMDTLMKIHSTMYSIDNLELILQSDEM